MKKTIHLVNLIEMTNKYLAYEGYGPTDEMRLGAASLLENALHECGAYAGYNHIYSAESPKFNNSRRFYFTKPRLLKK